MSNHVATAVARPRRFFVVIGLILALVPLPNASAQPPQPKPLVREIFVPFDSLSVLIGNKLQRVFLSRAEYEALLKKAQPAANRRVPFDAALLSASYQGRIEKGRLLIDGELSLEVLKPGLHAVPMALSGVGVLAATLDGKSAALVHGRGNTVRLLVHGVGRHKVQLKLAAPLTVSAALQAMNFQLPHATASRFSLTVPGNVEVKSGAQVVRRAVDTRKNTTTFDFLLKRGGVSIVMSLNNHLLQRQQVIVARSVLIDDLTLAEEKLSGNITVDVLHGAAQKIVLDVPQDFDISSVTCPQMSRWNVLKAAGKKQVEVTFRDALTTATTIQLQAHRIPPRLDGWSMPQIQPQGVSGHAAVVGVVAERRLAAREFTAKGLIPLDSTRILKRISDRKRSRAVVAYYAPDGANFTLQGTFHRPPPKLSVRSSTLLVVDEKMHRAAGSISATADAEKMFAIDFAAPTGWIVTRVTHENGQPIQFEQVKRANGSRIHVKLPKSVAPGVAATILFHAESTPPSWLSNWTEQGHPFPKFSVEGTATIAGAVAIQIVGDMEMSPENAQELVPLEEKDRKQYGLATDSVAAAYQFNRSDYQLGLRFRRKTASMSAKSYSFFRLERGKLVTHMELMFDIRRAKTRQLSFQLPTSTPNNISIRGLGGVTVKETNHNDQDSRRTWQVRLAEARQDRIHLVIDFEQQIKVDPSTELKLPRIVAQGVRFQTGLVSVEGHPDFDVNTDTKSRAVDVGELVAAKYVPGRYLLGAFRFVDAAESITLDVARRIQFDLPEAIIQRARLDTLVAVNGQMVTQADYSIRTNAQFLEAQLPTDAKLWSVTLDGKPLTPQSAGDALILGLTSKSSSSVRRLKVVYQSQGGSVSPWGRLRVPALQIAARNAAGKSRTVPIADVRWRVLLPKGLRVMNSSGNLRRESTRQDVMQVLKVAGVMHVVAGGIRTQEVFNGFAEQSDEVAVTMAPKKSKKSARGPLAFSGSQSTTPPQTPDAAMGQMMDSIQGDRPAGSMNSMKSMSGGGLGGMGGGARFGAKMKSDLASPRRQGRKSPQRSNRNDPRATPPRVSAAPNGRDGRAPFTPSPKRRPTRPADDKSVKEDAARPRLTQTAGKPQTAALPTDWTLEGVRSLKMDIGRLLDNSSDVVGFRSLGEAPELDITVADETRLTFLAWAVALIIGFIGVCLTRKSIQLKTTYVVVVLITSSVLPLVTGMIESLGLVFDSAFFAGAALVVYFVLAKVSCGFCRLCCNCCGLTRQSGAAATTAIMLVCIGHSAVAQQNKTKPITIPQDAVIIPYDPAKGIANIKKADRILVPYEKYLELQRLADPSRVAKQPPVVPFAFAASQYNATLSGTEHVIVQGEIGFEIYTQDAVMVPLPLAGGVLLSAQVDGQPAKIKLAGTTNNAKKGQNLIVALVRGQGRHQLKLQIRMRVTKRGGWRQLAGQVPVGVTANLTLAVPQANTDVRLSGIKDRTHHTTTAANQRLTTSLTRGPFGIQWRPKVTSGDVDRSLTANSIALVDIRDDGVRVIWNVSLTYRRGRRGEFTVVVPASYQVDDVTGTNVRGWQRRAKPQEAVQQIDVTLLNAVAKSASFQIHLAARGAVPETIRRFRVPNVRVRDAVLHRGRLSLRRSPLIRLRSLQTVGVSRTSSFSAKALERSSRGWSNPPSGVHNFQTFQFAADGFRLEYATAAVGNTAVANLQNILRVADARTDLESRIVLRGQTKPIHRVSVRIPTNVEVTQVMPAGLEWSIEESFTFRTLTVRMPTGRSGQFVIGVVGHINQGANDGSLTLPQMNVERVRNQQAEFVVQGDPTVQVVPTGLQNCERIFTDQVRQWLSSSQSRLARLVLRCHSGEYAGTLTLTTNRTPKIDCMTITNVRVTDKATIEETILLSYSISNAGTRQIRFQLPGRLKNAVIRAQKVRRTVIRGGATDNEPIVVTLELQEEVMGQFLVVVEDDRLLTLESHAVSIPVIQGATPTEQIATLQYQGRDEMTENATGFEPLNRQQRRWQQLAQRFPKVFQGNISKVYVAQRVATRNLQFQAKPRPELKTAGARIGLSTTTLVVDPNGAYRASQVFSLNNRTEQYLEIQLPGKARLWSVIVNGMPVKATVSPTTLNHVRIPLVKTAIGAEDYPVRITFGGKVNVGWYSTVKFPTAKTVNINVELSRLRLFLPETHQWFRFAGAERQENREKYQAQELMYLNSQVQRTAQAMQSKSAFDKARARATLKALNAKARAARRRFGNLGDRQGILNRNDLELRSNLRELNKSARKVTTAKSKPAFGNRARFNQLLENQRAFRSRNIVQGLDNNFKYSGQTPQTKGGKTPMQQLQQQFAGQQAAQAGSGKGKAAKTRTRGTVSKQELAKIYQKQIESKRPNLAANQRVQLQGHAQSEEKSSEQGGSPSTASTGAATGLKSLDVKIPTRGREVLFLTPRGDLQLTSVALRSDIVLRLQRLGILALVGIATGIGFAVRKPVKKVAASAVGVTLMLLVGIVGMLLQVYPIAALLLTIVAIGLAIVRRRR